MRVEKKKLFFRHLDKIFNIRFRSISIFDSIFFSLFPRIFLSIFHLNDIQNCHFHLYISFRRSNNCVDYQHTHSHTHLEQNSNVGMKIQKEEKKVFFFSLSQCFVTLIFSTPNSMFKDIQQVKIFEKKKRSHFFSNFPFCFVLFVSIFK